jgi:hypothetical protein
MSNRYAVRGAATAIVVIAITGCLAGPTPAEPAHANTPYAKTPYAKTPYAKTRHGRIWHGYGFLPGYRPPEQIEWELNHRTRNWYGAPIYWYGWPGFYRGRWNGGGFGPCWTPTPIGPSWNCG